MTDVPISKNGKPLSMTPLAIRKRASRAGIPLRDFVTDGGHPRATSKLARDASRSIRLATSRDAPCDAFSHPGASQVNVTLPRNQRLKLVPRSQDAAPNPGPSRQSLPGTLDKSPSGTGPPSARRVTLPIYNVTLLEAVLSLLAIAAMVASLGTNITSVLAQAQSPTAMVVWALIVVVYEGGSMALPSGIAAMWRARSYVLWAFLCLFMAVCSVFAWLAAISFSTANSGDTVAQRSAGKLTITELRADQARDRADRDKLSFKPTSEEAVSEAREAADRSCERRTPLRDCEAKRAEARDQQGHHDRAKRAAELDAAIARRQERIDLEPVKGAADPRAEGAQKFVAAFSRGAASIDPIYVDVIFMLSITVLPWFGGLLFACVGVLRERRRRDMATRDAPS